MIGAGCSERTGGIFEVGTRDTHLKVLAADRIAPPRVAPQTGRTFFNPGFAVSRIHVAAGLALLTLLGIIGSSASKPREPAPTPSPPIVMVKPRVLHEAPAAQPSTPEPPAKGPVKYRIINKP